MDTNLFDPVLTADVLASSSGCAASLLGVTRAFGGQSVLRGIDLAIPAGQFVAIVGRSGCGKSTLLRLLAGLDQPSSGRIEIDGRSIGWRDQVRLMFQEPRLLPWQRIAANVAVGLPGTLPRDDRRRAAQAALSRVGLADRAGEWPSVLSGGQKQRVALARALASHPRMLAFDEPLGALDALTRIEMQCLIEQVWLEKGFTAIVVTHDVSEAVALADRILLLDSGRIAMDVPVAIPQASAPGRSGSGGDRGPNPGPFVGAVAGKAGQGFALDPPRDKSLGTRYLGLK